MDATIIAQKTQQRYERALQIAATPGSISPNGSPDQFYVQSQNGRGRYLIASPAEYPPLGLCSCRDFKDFGSHNGIACKHIQAAVAHAAAEDFVREQAKTHNLTWQRVIDLAHARLAYATDDLMADRWRIVIVTAQRLIASQAEGDREYCKRHPFPLDHIQTQINNHPAAIADLHAALRREPGNLVAQAQLSGLRETVGDLTEQARRIEAIREMS
jgi:hypothetical protein